MEGLADGGETPRGEGCLLRGARKAAVVVFGLAALMLTLGADELLGSAGPRVVERPDGAAIYHLTGSMTPVVAPVAAMLAAVVLGLWIDRRIFGSPIRRRARTARVGVVGRIVQIFFIILFLGLFVLGVAIDFRSYRQVVVAPEQVELRSLFWSRALSRSQIDRAEASRAVVTGRTGPREQLFFLVVTTAGERLESFRGAGTNAALAALLDRLEGELRPPAPGDPAVRPEPGG